MARLLALVMIRNVRGEGPGVSWVALVCVFDLINGGRFDLASRHI